MTSLETALSRFLRSFCSERHFRSYSISTRCVISIPFRVPDYLRLRLNSRSFCRYFARQSESRVGLAQGDVLTLLGIIGVRTHHGFVFTITSTSPVSSRRNYVILMSVRLCYTLSSEWPCVLSAKYVNDRIPMKSVQLQICGYPEGDCSVAAVGFLEFPH